MRKLLILLSIIAIHSCSSKEEVKGTQHLAVCSHGNGCQFSELTISSDEVDYHLGKTNFWTSVSPGATLILENCESKLEEDKTLTEIHHEYGGVGEPNIQQQNDITKYLLENACLNCPNTTKKISFYIRADDMSGNGYFFLNLTKGEAFMPNEAFQQIYAGQEGTGDLIVDQFLRNGHLEQYLVAEGKKYLNKMPIGTDIAMIKEDELNEQRFKNDFRKTGSTRKHLNTSKNETEYTGKDDEGNTITIWLTPVQDVCLPEGKFDAFGFYNLGYISVDRVTYLVTQISGPGFEMRMTAISEGNYQFNTDGYQPLF